MKKILATAVLLLCSGIFLTGCPGPKSEIMAVDVVATPTGTIEGYLYIQQFNERRAAAATDDDDEIIVPAGHKPIQGAKVTATGCPNTTYTDVHGYFVLDEVAEGPQTVTITKDGYGVTTLNRDVRSGATTLLQEAIMNPATGGAMTVTSTPAGANIYIDNINTYQKTPHTFNPMKTGVHTVYVTILGYDTPETRTSVVAEDQMTELKFLLVESEPIYLEIKIRSEFELGTWLVWTGTSEQFIADCMFSDGSSVECTPTALWSSADETVGTVGAHSGLFQAKSTGTTQVTVALDGPVITGQSDTIYVTILQSDLESISVTPTTAIINSGYNQQFTAICRSTDGTETSCTSIVSWTSTDTGKGTVDAVGLFTAIAEGSTTLFASWQGKVSNSVSITVAPPSLTAISVTPSSPDSIAAGYTQQFIATCTYSDETSVSCTNNVDWASSAPPSVGTIGLKTGLFTGLAEGSTLISASWQLVDSNSPEMTVTPPVITSIVVSPSSAQVVVKTFTQQFTATCTYSDGFSESCTNNVDWSLSDFLVGTIGENTGLFVALEVGVTIIYATYDGTPISEIPVTVTE